MQCGCEDPQTAHLDLNHDVHLGDLHVCASPSHLIPSDHLYRTLMGIVKGFGGLVTARFFLGVCEVSNLMAQRLELSLTSAGRLLSRSIVPVDTLLQTIRGTSTIGSVLLHGVIVRCLLWSACLCSGEDGRYWRS